MTNLHWRLSQQIGRCNGSILSAHYTLVCDVQPNLFKPSSSTPVVGSPPHASLQPREGDVEPSMPHALVDREPILSRTVSVWKRDRLGRLIECREDIPVEAPPAQDQLVVSNDRQVKTKTILGEAAFPVAQPGLSAHQLFFGPTKYRFLKGQVVGQPFTRGEGKKDSANAHMDPVMFPRHAHDSTSKQDHQVVDLPTVPEPLGHRR